MNLVFNGATLAILILMTAYLGRALAGPTVFDRVVALNGMGTLVAVVLVLLGMVYNREDMFVDLALAVFMLNLFTTLLIARHVRHKAADQ